MSTENTKKKYIVEMQVARGFGILLVSFGHSEPVRQAFPLVWNIIYSFHMPLFFFMSGFFSLNLINRSWIKNILPSTLRLYLPYIVISLSYGIIKLLIPSLAKRPVIPHELISDILFYPFNNPALFLWFIYILLFMKLLSPLFRQQRTKWLIPVFFLTACWSGSIELFGIFSLLKHLIYYTAGLFIAEKQPLFFALLKNNLLRILALLLFPAFYFFSTGHESGPLPVLTAMSGIWLTLSISCITLPPKISQVIEYCGKLSLEIYLLQYYFIFPTLFVLKRWGMLPQLIVPFTFTAGIIGPIVACHLILNRNRPISLIFSGRTQR